HQVSQVWAKTPGAVCPVDCMAVQARSSLEDASSRDCFFIFVRLLLLFAHPRLEVFRSIHVRAQKHFRVLGAAVLCALAKKQAGLVRIEPRFVYPIRNQVGLSSKLWYPETVIRVGGKQFQECRCGMRRVTHGNMGFSVGNHTEPGIAEFPPKLVSNCGYLQSFSRLRRVLNCVNDSCRHEKKHDNDQNRNDGPGEFNLRASIHLRWLAVCVRRSAAELHDDVSQQTEDHYKNQSGDAEDEEREMTDRIRWRGVRIENAGNGVDLRSCGAQPRGGEDACEEKGNALSSSDDRWPIGPLHCLDDPHQVSPLRTSGERALVTASAVEDQDRACTREPCN